MNKKNGFTLVEVIAVIVIMAIIATITTAIVITTIEDSRRGAFKNSSFNVFKAAELFEAKNIFTSIPENGIDVTDDQIELENNNFISGKIIRNEENELEVEFLTDGIYCADGEKSNLRVVKGDCYLLDDTAPEDIVIVIDNITSNSFRIIVEGDDLESGIREYQYSIDGINYTTKPGNNYTFNDLQMGNNYTIYVRVVNNNGLISELFTKQIVTKEIPVPTYSINKTGWQTEKIVTIYYPIDQADYTYQYSVDSGNTWITTDKETQNVTFNSNGSVIARVYDGINYKTASSYTVSGIDTTAPSANVTLYSKTTNTVTVIASGTDSQSGIIKYEFRIDGGAYVSNGTTPTYLFTNLTTGNHTVKVRVTNGSGLTTESSELTVAPSDIESPTYSINATGWQTSKIVTITYPTRQTGFIYQYSTNGGTTWTTVASGTTQNVTFNNNGSVIARVYDGTNYKTASSYAVSQIDNSAPTANVTLYSKTTNTITVVASGTDSESGITKYEYSIDGGSYVSNGTTATYTFTGVTTGNHTIKVRTTNGSGLTTESNVLTVAPNDIESPTYSINLSGWQTSKIVTITYPTRQTGFIYQYSTNGGTTWTTVASGTTQTVTFNNNGSVIARVYDGTNYKTSSSYTVNQIDNSAPTAGVTLSSKTTNTITVVASGTDSESGITRYEFSIDGGTYINNGTNATYTFTGVTTGNHTVKVRTTNGSGLTTESTEITVSPIDIEAPTYSVNATGWQTSKIVTINYPTRQTGFVYEYSTNAGSTWTTVSSGTTQTVTFNANGSVIARIYDGTNYKNASSYSVSGIDTTAPSLTLSASTSNTKTITIPYSASDSQSGISSYTCKYSTTSGSYTLNGSATSTTCTITNLADNTTYYYQVCTNDNVGRQTCATGSKATTLIATPTYSVNTTGWQKSKIVTITYPARQTDFVYQYSTNGGSTWTTVASGTTQTVTFSSNGAVIARIYDGTNYQTASSYTVSQIDTTVPTIPTAIAGSMIYLDPTFASGTNSTVIYNNTGNGNVTITRVSLSNPYGSGYGLQIKTVGAASPEWGGFYFATPTSANKVFISKVVAKIPVGYNINWASNAYGGGTTEWLSSTEGTGNWKEYIFRVNVGTNGSYSSTNFFYLTGGSTPTTTTPLIWHVAYATVYDTTRWGTSGNISIKANDAESGVVAYGINQSSTTQPSYTTVTSTTSLATVIHNINANGTYYVWVKDAAGNVNKQAVTVSYVDTNSPTVSAKGTSYTITQGASNVISSTYFNIAQNGGSSISSTTCTSNVAGAVSNTSTLGVGTHTITCTVTKENGKSASASTTIVVNPAYYQETVTINFPSSTTYTRSGSQVLTGYHSLVSVTVNNGTVSHSMSGSTINVTATGGTATSQQTCGNYYSCSPACVCNTSCWSCTESYTGTCCGCPGQWGQPLNCSSSCCSYQENCGYSYSCSYTSYYSYVVTVTYLRGA